MAEIVDCQVTQEDYVCAGGKSTTSIPPALGPEVSKFKGTCTLVEQGQWEHSSESLPCVQTAE